MDYLITLDGPTHLYNSANFNRILVGDTFTTSFLEINSSITPNYASLLILSFLMLFFNGIIALKIFHLFFVLLFALSFVYWNKGKSNNSYLVIPLIFSYLFFSGFYNFILAIILMFWILTFYERTKLATLPKYLILTVLLLLLYFSHSIVFAFTGIALALYEITKWLAEKKNFKSLLLPLSLLLLAALPCVIFTFFFMGARDSEVHFLSFSQLLANLTLSKSIITKSVVGEFTKYIFTFLIIIISIVLMLSKLRKRIEPSDYLGITALTMLVCYFILPDSVGYASVFSVRIEYIFWVFLFAWIARQKLNKTIIKYGLGIFTVILISIQQMGYVTFLQPLNFAAKKVMAADEIIPTESIIYPIFTSNVWEHLHISNLLGAEKNLFILENNGAREDYFPVQYKQPYEALLDSLPNLYIPQTNFTIDYVLKIGKNPAESQRDITIYNAIRNEGELIYQNDLIEVWGRKK